MVFSLTSILPPPDMLALGWFFLCWVGYAWYADHRRWGTRELASVRHSVRMKQMRSLQLPSGRRRLQIERAAHDARFVAAAEGETEALEQVQHRLVVVHHVAAEYPDAALAGIVDHLAHEA